MSTAQQSLMSGFENKNTNFRGNGAERLEAVKRQNLKARFLVEKRWFQKHEYQKECSRVLSRVLKEEVDSETRIEEGREFQRRNILTKYKERKCWSQQGFRVRERQEIRRIEEDFAFEAQEQKFKIFKKLKED